MSDDEYSSNCLFNPSMAVQRYIFTRNAIQRYNKDNNKDNNEKNPPISTVLDLGCNECHLVRFLKQLSSLKVIHCLDLQTHHLQFGQRNVRPSAMDYLKERQHQLTVHLYTGSALQPDGRFGGDGGGDHQVDAVTAIELVEHLWPQTELPAFVSTVFGHIRPKLVVITTPNAEYNSLIQRAVAEAKKKDADAEDGKEPGDNSKNNNNSSSNGFRDADHKFEWTREQFASWCTGVVQQYDDYRFHLDGVGRLAADTEQVTGYCTQIALFTRKVAQDRPSAGKTSQTKAGEVYKLFSSHCYRKSTPSS